MNAALTVIVPESVRVPMTAALASLPRTFKTGDASEGAIHVIAGSAGWVDRIEQAASAGAAGVLLMAPSLSPSIARAVEAAGVIPIVIGHQWTGNPAVAGLSRWADEMSAANAVSVTGVIGLADGRELETAALDALSLAARLTGGDPELTSVRSSATAMTIIGTVGGAILRVGLVRSEFGPPQARASVHAARLQHTALIPSAGNAAPARISRVSVEGELVLSSIYQDSHRTNLLALARAIGEHALPTDLLELEVVARGVRDVRSTA